MRMKIKSTLKYLNKIREFDCPTIHPAAQLIKQLVFDRDENGERGIHNDVHASLYVSGDVFLKQRYIFLISWNQTDILKIQGEGIFFLISWNQTGILKIQIEIAI